MFLDIVIPSYHDDDWLQALLKTLDRQELSDVSITIAYDESQRGMLQNVSAPKFQAVYASRGIGNARNAGAAAGDGEWILFLDADGLLPDDFISDIKNLLRKSAKFDAATFSFYADSRRLILRAGTRLSWRYLQLMNLFGRPALSGIATLVRRSTFDSIGGYRNDLAISEDFDFSDQILDAGYEIKLFRSPWFVYSARRFDLPCRDAFRLFWWYLIIDLRRRLYGELIPEGKTHYPFGTHKAPPTSRRRPDDINPFRLRRNANLRD
jgi:GT2 family glycosyltransferase